MGIDGLIILENATGFVHDILSSHPALTRSRSRPFIQSGFRASATANPLLHLDALSAALARAPEGRPDDVEPVIALPSSSGSACCHVREGELRFVCPISGGGEWSAILVGCAWACVLKLLTIGWLIVCS